MLIDKKVGVAEEEAYDHIDEDEATYDTHDAARQGLGLGALIDENPQSNVLSKAQLHEQNQTYELERERQLFEFKRDREFVILSIQGALKARRHKEAQELVFQYRLASEFDSEFRRLAQLTKSACFERSAVADLLSILDATPDADHVTRYALYGRLLKLEPTDQEFKMGYQISAQALDLKQPQSHGFGIGQVVRTILVFAFIIIGPMLFAVGVFYLLAEGGRKYEEEQKSMEKARLIDKAMSVDDAGPTGDVMPTVYTKPTDFEVPEPDVQVIE